MIEGEKSELLAVDAVFQYGGSIVQFLSGLAFYFILIRIFSTVEVGTVVLLSAIIGLFNVFFSFGLGAAARHFISYYLGRGDYFSIRRTVRKIFLLALSLSTVGILTIFSLSRTIALVFFHSTSFTPLIQLVSLAFLGNTLFGILNSIILGIQKFRLSATISALTWFIYYFGALAFAVILHSVNAVVFGWSIGMFLGLVLDYLVIANSFRNGEEITPAPSNRVILVYSFPIVVSGVVSYGATSVDRFIVSGMLNLSLLGIYNLALIIISSLSFLAVPFNNMLIPKLSERFARSDKEGLCGMVSISISLLSFIYVPVALIIASIAPSVLDILGGSEYIPGAVPLQIILFFSSAFITENILASAIASVRRTRILLYSTGTALFSNILLSFLLIPSLGITGAAIGYSSVFGVTFLVQYFFASREGIVQLDKLSLVKIWTSAILMFVSIEVLSYFFGQKIYLIGPYALVGFVVYGALVKIFRPFTIDSANAIIETFPKRFAPVRRIIHYFLVKK